MASEAWTLVERRHRRGTRGEKGSTHRRGTRGEKGSTQKKSTTTTEGLRAGRAGEASAREGTDVSPPHQHNVLVDDDDVNPEEPPQGSKPTPSDFPKRKANSWKQITVMTHNVQG